MILTPATGLGDVLVERLRLAGMQIEVEMMQAHRGGQIYVRHTRVQIVHPNLLFYQL